MMRTITALIAIFISLNFAHGQKSTSGKSVIDLSKYVLVEGGAFKMGTDQPVERHESPKHEIRLNNFYISKYEVTFEEYDKFCSATKRDTVPSGNWGRGKNPVFMVSWLDAIAYCNWLSEKEKLSKCYLIKGDEVLWIDTARGYRLPTEAEWEYAARGGNKNSTAYFAGDTIVGNVAWYADNSNGKVQPVGQKPANELGLHDMNGNVWEWVWDWYDWNYYRYSPVQNPAGPKVGGYKVMRGGAWYNYGNYANVYTRQNHQINYKQNSVGFRVARNYVIPGK